MYSEISEFLLREHAVGRLLGPLGLFLRGLVAAEAAPRHAALAELFQVLNRHSQESKEKITWRRDEKQEVRRGEKEIDDKSFFK